VPLQSLFVGTSIVHLSYYRHSHHFPSRVTMQSLGYQLFAFYRSILCTGASVFPPCFGLVPDPTTTCQYLSDIRCASVGVVKMTKINSIARLAWSLVDQIRLTAGDRSLFSSRAAGKSRTAVRFRMNFDWLSF
jgi:hypothetical protein